MGEGSENWFITNVKKEVEKDVIPYTDQVGNFVSIVFTILFTGYFVSHQTWSTGFFTSKFGPLEMFLFYASILYQIVPASVKILMGRKNPARVFEVVGALLTTTALLWSYIVFPFNFGHLADVLPSSIRVLLKWISNDLARLAMILAIIVTPITAVYNAVLYIFVHQELTQSSGEKSP
ncbi:MAG: hypothetical protein ACOC6H_02215 [Thermoproteota archaeon]